MPRAVVGIGLPGTGKTDVLRKRSQKLGEAFICIQDIRRRPQFESCPPEQRNSAVWKAAYEEIEAALRQGRDVVIDAANSDRHFRKELVEHCRQAGATCVIGLRFSVPLQLVQKSNAESADPMPDEALASMNRQLDQWPPQKSEGFNEIRFIRMSQTH